ncbi:MAG TPA: hypothetical protein VIU13_14335 [Chryseolinea sp.]
MLTPRAYLSFSQMTTFEMSPQKYADHYIYGKEQRVTINMAYGSRMAEGLEFEEATGDPLLDMMMAQIPKFELMDKPIEADLPFGKGVIRLLAKPDTAKADFTAFKEYKTSVRKWTQKMADDSGQITFYATVMWLLTHRIPQDIELVNVQVKYQDDGQLTPTGEILRFRTHRTMVDILKMTARMKRAWKGINDLCAEELL